MKKLIFIFLIFPTIIYGQFEFFKMRFDSLWAQSDTNTFRQTLEKYNLSFHKPDSFVIEPVHKNYDVFYHYAIKHVTKKVEIRYVIRYLDNMSFDTNSLDADKFSFSIFSLLTMNAAGSNFSNMPVINILDKTDYPKNLPVVWAAYSDFNPSSDFGKDYLFCRTYGFRLKNDIMIYYILLFENYFKDSYLEKSALESINTK
ncbi:MAG: hypothetical protein ABIJ97_16770 [Bacteroidota bacterium]